MSKCAVTSSFCIRYSVFDIQSRNALACVCAKHEEVGHPRCVLIRYFGIDTLIT